MTIIPAAAGTPEAIAATQDYISRSGFHVTEADLAKPWGAYFYVDPTDIDAFRSSYFPDFPIEQLHRFGSQLQPKFLLVAPDKRLSWQYHNRRAELWNVVEGPVGVITSPDDIQGVTNTVTAGSHVQFDALTRHRLCGLNNWGLVAEIWQHTDASRLSDETDIVRVADDFAR